LILSLFDFINLFITLTTHINIYMSKVVLVTGGFDPLHSGHIEYFKAARELGDHLVVGLNSDSWLTRKKGRPFMSIHERAAIIEALECVDEVIAFDDSDNTACAAIMQVLSTKSKSWTVVFANGGDRTNTTTPEYQTYGDRKDVEFAFGVGGEDKKNSSSWILEEWKAPKTERVWGYYRVLHEVLGCKVKELTVDPGKSLSMQRHYERAEYWLVSEGRCIVNAALANGYALPSRELSMHQEYKVPVGEWHQLTNPYDVPCRIVEIQYGENCVEEDIERRDL
jgi:cytidyltransferase-like protein